MPTRVGVRTEKAPPPLPFYSQAIICNGMVYCSGSIGVDPVTSQMVEGGIGDRTVGHTEESNNESRQTSLIWLSDSSLKEPVRCSGRGWLFAEECCQGQYIH